MNNLVLHLGSNIGDRQAQLQEAIHRDRIRYWKSKSAHPYTKPKPGVKDQDDFLNQVLIVATSLDAENALLKCKSIEKDMGSIKNRNLGARTIDIDVLFFNDTVVVKRKYRNSPPYDRKRNFVLIPLMEIMGEYIHPVLQKQLKNYTKKAMIHQVWIYD